MYTFIYKLQIQEEKQYHSLYSILYLNIKENDSHLPNSVCNTVSLDLGMILECIHHFITDGSVQTQKCPHSPRQSRLSTQGDCPC